MYTLQGILVVPVKYSEEFAENMVSRAEDFYRSQVVSVLLYGHTVSTVGLQFPSDFVRLLFAAVNFYKVDLTLEPVLTSKSFQFICAIVYVKEMH